MRQAVDEIQTLAEFDRSARSARPGQVIPVSSAVFDALRSRPAQLTPEYVRQVGIRPAAPCKPNNSGE